MSKVDQQESAAPNLPEGVAVPQMPRIRWVTDDLKSSYANFANANSTREEVVLNFGLNNSWDRAQQEIAIELSHRIMLSPFAAKRLSAMLAQLIAEYEQRYGQLD